MKQGLTEIVCIIDRSGSMQTIKNDTIGGFNQFLEDQKKLSGDAKLSLVLFSWPGKEEIIYNSIDIQEVPELTEATYKPNGNTALYDAICNAVDNVGNRLSVTPEEQRPEKVVVVILTDGLENSSKEFGQEDALKRITHQQEKYDWDFIYLGANQDAFEVGGGLGIRRDLTSSYAATRKGVRTAYSIIGSHVSTSRAGQSITNKTP